MSKNKGFDIAAALNAPHFQEQSGNGQLSPDPAIPTRIRVNLDNVVPCSRNPRKTRNPKFDDIKESIRNRGLDEPPQVTRKDPSHPYMIKRGGNSRLEILNELWSETQDSKFYEFDCMFMPWPKEGELELLVGSIVENEERGDMLFIERAIAAVDTKLLLEARDGKELGPSALSRELKKMGWSIDQSNLGQLLYAHHHLFLIIPDTFWHGMARDGTKKIRKMLEDARTFWASVARSDEGNFDQIWQNAFAALDGDAFELGEAQNQLEADIAQHLDVSYMAVRGEVQAISQGVSPGGVRPSNLITEPHAQTTSQQGAAPNPQASNATSRAPIHSTPAGQSGDAQSPVVSENTHSQILASKEQGQSQGNGGALASQTSDELHTRLAKLPTSDLMYHCYEIAHEIALIFNFESLIATAEGIGFTGLNGFHSGYVLFPENPDAPLSDEATFYYLYLHQLSCWFVDDHDKPEFSLVSHHVPLSFLEHDYYWQIAEQMLHKRATILVAWKQGHRLGQYLPLIEEIEVAVALIGFRAGVGAE